VTIRNADLDRWDEEAENVYLLINASLAHLPDFIPWQLEAVKAILASFRNIADPELIFFAEVEGKVVGFFPGIPNLNEVLIHVNGLRYPWDYLKLLWHMRRKPESLTIKSINILPEYWGTPVSILLFTEMAKRARAKGYKWADLSLTSDDNPNTPILAERMGARVYKRYQVYRCRFN
jgi:GNAT superfamily N-acetyltransferase